MWSSQKAAKAPYRPKIKVFLDARSMVIMRRGVVVLNGGTVQHLATNTWHDWYIHPMKCARIESIRASRFR